MMNGASSLLSTSFVAGSHRRSASYSNSNSSSSSFTMVRFSTVTHRVVGPMARSHKHRKFAGSLRRMGDELYLRRLPLSILAAVLITKFLPKTTVLVSGDNYCDGGRGFDWHLSSTGLLCRRLELHGIDLSIVTFARSRSTPNQWTTSRAQLPTHPHIKECRSIQTSGKVASATDKYGKLLASDAEGFRKKWSGMIEAWQDQNPGQRNVDPGHLANKPCNVTLQREEIQE
ncbi:hypothetical protein EGW08_005644 [Elysia chlorotica]|uniref:Uncharacterized protein n=1 Tax=Elysia chlorotica TaxID=188477 RepID=A0A433TYP8_ELYCH|nr:hypothetical protein EGW08_005644 [Elysia chlorotica]